MVSKYLKYALLLNAEVVSRVASKVKENTEDFVKTNADADYEKSLDKVFDDIEQKLKDFSPELEKVSTSIHKLKESIMNVPNMLKK